MSSIIKTKTVEISGQTVRVRVFSPDTRRSHPKMKLRGKQQSDLKVVGKWSRGVCEGR